MQRVTTSACIALGIVLLAASSAHAQYLEDALRLGQFGTGVGARALGMGNAYTGIASDYSAVFWNPAGLTQALHGEFFLGLSYLNNGDNGTLSSRDGMGNITLLGNPSSYTTTATNINAVGVVYPVPVRRGNLVLAFGYDRRSNFASGVSFTGFNPGSSFIQTIVPDKQTLPSGFTSELPWQLGLTDTANGKYKAVFNGRMTQLGNIIESGGLNDWSAAAGIEVGKNLSVGVTLTLVSGSYRYDRNYSEQDRQHLYSYPFDLQELKVTDYIDGDITGANAKFGLMYTVPDRFRLGIGIRTPTSYAIKEHYGQTLKTTFYTLDSAGNNVYGPFDYPGSVEYDVHTPWVFSIGASVILRDLVLSGDMEYTDWTQLEFANANSDLLALNPDFKTRLRGTANLRGGAEYDIRDFGLRLRAGFIYNPSPFQGDPSTFDQKYVTAGLGFLLGESAMLDVAYAHGWWQAYQSNYSQASNVEEGIKTNTVLVTLVYRF
jgi:long-subunit fatty acid transport protein